MWIADAWQDYELLDCSAGEKLERWDKYILLRPDPQAIWHTPRDRKLWSRYDARYARSGSGGGQWAEQRVPASWTVRYRTCASRSGR